MNKSWLLIVFILSFFMLASLKSFELASLTPFFKAERVIKLKNFSEAKNYISKKEDLELLKLWESMITGRSAPLSRWMKDRYRLLGLNHLFTPSGFHISAVLFPFMKLIKTQRHQFLLILILGIGSIFLPGMSALKRMLLIKGHQKIWGFHLGFILAILIDVLFGSFQNGALSFTYSFLFIGIIYSGAKGLTLIVWFFIAQMLLGHFQGSDISPLLIVFSPLLNFSFGLAMPLLFLLAFPLWEWQFRIGIFLLKILQYEVDFMASLSQAIPSFEVNIGILVICILLILKKRKITYVLSLFLSFSLNLDRAKSPGVPANEFIPRGEILKTIYEEKHVRILRTDGNCKLKLVRGIWWESCSPKRKSSRKKIKKLSYPS